MDFRTLEASEIDCRVATINSKGLSLLLYKDARVDQNILDETVGQMNWQRHHSRDNANCIVSIWDENKKQWIEKEDTGKESFTEAEKGLASDSFKRACFNWGIGRELYSAPFIWIYASDTQIENENGKYKCKDSFSVDSITYDSNRNIVGLVIKNKQGEIVFSLNEDLEKTKIDATKVSALKTRLKNEGVPLDNILKPYKVNRLEDLTEKQFSNINLHWDQVKGWKAQEG